VTDRVVLQVRGLQVRDAMGRDLLDDVNLVIRAGEVLGIAGVEGNGQTELVEAVMGIRPATAGTVQLAGDDVTSWGTRRRRAAGVGYVPEDRQRHGLLLDAPLWENRILGHQTRPPSAKGVWLDTGGARGDAERIVDSYDVRTPGVDTSARSLSGGNQQKFIVGREMSGNPCCCSPPIPPAASTSVPRPLSGTTSAPPDGTVSRSCWSRPTSTSSSGCPTPSASSPGPSRRHLRPADGHPAAAGLSDDRRPGGDAGMRLVRRFALAATAPLLAFIVAAAVTTIVLLIAGDSPADFWRVLLSAPEPRNYAFIANSAAVLYLSGLAAAVAFRMNLFNIGVEGQYRVATFAAAVFAGEAFLPGYLNTVAAIVVAMAAGALWAGIAAVLRVTRGVSEVISTIMLNAIALSLVSYLLQRVGSRRGQTFATDEIPESSWVGGIPFIPGESAELYGLALLAVLAGVAFSVLLKRTRFGFELRATGQSETAAVASGVNVKRMIVISMLLSGAVAGLIGMPELFGASHLYGSTSRPASASPASLWPCWAATRPGGSRWVP
jgi:simple sugar transport system permease protein